jgi:hypothetical protein
MIFYFSTGVLLICYGCWQLLTGYISVAGYLLATTCLTFFIPGSVMAGSYPPSRLWPTAIILFSISIVTIVGDFFASSAINSVICHPAFVVLLWIFLMLRILLRWKWQKERETNA